MGQTQTADDDTRVVQLLFRPSWPYLEGIRRLCELFATTTFDEEHLGPRVAMVVQELVENAIRYGHHEGASMLELTLRSHEDEVEVVVTNSSAAEPAEDVRTRLASITKEEPEASYRAAMERARARPVDQSGLGFPRIRHEGQMTLSATFDETLGTLRVSARGKV